MSSDIQALKEKLLREAKESTGGTFWIPKQEGEYLFGKVIRERTVRVNIRGQEKDVKAVDIHCLDDDLVYTVLLTHKVLARLWEEKNVQPGDIVLIYYKGPVTDNNGNVKYYLYGLGVEHTGEQGEEIPEFYIKESEEEIEEEEKATEPEVPETKETGETKEEVKKPVTLEELVEKKEEKKDPLTEASRFLINMLDFYEELSKEDIQQLLETKGINVDVDELIRYLQERDKVIVEGDVVKPKK